MNQDLKKEFGDRLITLTSGVDGIRNSFKCEVKMVSDDEAEFIASTASLDRYNEVVLQSGAIDTTNYVKNPVVLDSHRYYSIMDIIGRSTVLRPEKTFLGNRVKFATDNPLGEMARKMTKAEFIKAESIGFIPREWTRGNPAAGEPERTYTKIELLEISLVAVPANPDAVTLALKTGAIDRSDIRAVMEVLKEFCSTADPETIPGAPGPRIHERALHDLRSLQRALKG